jgi:hypothetical protein
MGVEAASGAGENIEQDGAGGGASGTSDTDALKEDNILDHVDPDGSEEAEGGSYGASEAGATSESDETDSDVDIDRAVDLAIDRHYGEAASLSNVSIEHVESVSQEASQIIEDKRQFLTDFAHTVDISAEGTDPTIGLRELLSGAAILHDNAYYGGDTEAAVLDHLLSNRRGHEDSSVVDVVPVSENLNTKYAIAEASRNTIDQLLSGQYSFSYVAGSPDMSYNSDDNTISFGSQDGQRNATAYGLVQMFSPLPDTILNEVQ